MRRTHLDGKVLLYFAEPSARYYLNGVSAIDVLVAAGAIPATLGELTSLKELRLHKNELTGECSCTNLVHLR